MSWEPSWLQRTEYTGDWGGFAETLSRHEIGIIAHTLSGWLVMDGVLLIKTLVDSIGASPSTARWAKVLPSCDSTVESVNVCTRIGILSPLTRSIAFVETLCAFCLSFRMSPLLQAFANVLSACIMHMLMSRWLLRDNGGAVIAMTSDSPMCKHSLD